MNIYTEITKKMLYKIENENYQFVIPDGVTVEKTHGNRGYTMQCDDDIKGEMIEAVENLGLAWQEI